MMLSLNELPLSYPTAHLGRCMHMWIKYCDPCQAYAIGACVALFERSKDEDIAAMVVVVV